MCSTDTLDFGRKKLCVDWFQDGQNTLTELKDTRRRGAAKTRNIDTTSSTHSSTENDMASSGGWRLVSKRIQSFKLCVETAKIDWTISCPSNCFLKLR